MLLTRAWFKCALTSVMSLVSAIVSRICSDWLRTWLVGVPPDVDDPCASPSEHSTCAKSSTCLTVILWPFTSAATPGPGPLHAVSSTAAPTPASARRTEVFTRSGSFVATNPPLHQPLHGPTRPTRCRTSSGHRHDRPVDHGVHDLACPREECLVAERLAADGSRRGTRHQDRTQSVLDDAAWVQARQPHASRLREAHRREPDVPALEGDLAQTRLSCPSPEAGHRQQTAHRLGRLAVTVEELLGQQCDVVVGAHLRQPLVHLEAQPLAGHVVVRQVGVDGQLDAHLPLLRLALALELLHGLADEPDVE